MADEQQQQQQQRQQEYPQNDQQQPERYRSVTDYDKEDCLRKALLTSSASCNGIGESGGERCLDWVLPKIDPETTEPQSTKEELQRLQVLKSYLILDNEPEEAFERITALASRIFKVPIALVSLVDLGRQWFTSNRGLGEVRETSRSVAFCSHAIQSKTNLLVVPDATKDFRFKDNPLVTGPPAIQFYAGEPLVSPEGYKLGTLCIIDSKSRPNGLEQDELEKLKDLSSMVVKVMVDRRNQLESREDPTKLIAYTAHDLITPLTAVQLSLSLLKDDSALSDALNSHQMELLTTASTCSDLMIRICETAIESLRQHRSVKGSERNNSTSLLPTSRDISMPVTKIPELVKSLQMVMEPIPMQVPLIITLDRAVPHAVVCDDLKLFRSALNLLSNATARTVTGKVHLRIYVREDGQLVIECEDTADDIQVEEYQYLFQPSRTEHNELRLGLSSVASHVNSLNGEYGFRPRALSADGTKLVDSGGRPLSGSIFWFSIPMLVSDESISLNSTVAAASEAKQLILRPRTANMPFLPVMLRSGSNNSVASRPLRSFSSGSNVHTSSERTNDESTTNAVFPPMLDRRPPTRQIAVQQGSLRDNHEEEDRKMPAVVQVSDSGTTASRDSSPKPPPPKSPRIKRALVIEDSLVVRKSLARALHNLGFEVSQAVNGLEGLKELQETLFDFVLLDFLMPVMDGLDCVQQYRAWEKENRPSYRQLIVGISAHVSVEDSKQGISAGMDSFYPKPITVKTLTELQNSDAVVAQTKLLDQLEGCEELSNSNVGDADTDATEAPPAAREPSHGPPSTATEEATAPPQKRPRTNSSVSDGSTHTVPVCLVATDTPSHAPNEFLKILERNGWKVAVVHDGDDTLRLLRMRNWNVVLIDDDIRNSSASKCIGDFRDWESKSRVNEQRNAFLVSESDIPDPSDVTSIVQPPSGFNGVLRKPIALKELNYLMKESSSKLKLNIVFRR